MGRLSGKVAFITGAGSGIGRECVRLFAGEGAKVIIADLDSNAGKKVETEIDRIEGEAFFIETDVTDDKSVAESSKKAASKFGAVHVLVNCAGGSLAQDNTVVDVDLQVLDHSISLDLKGTFLCCRHIIPLILSSGCGGAIVNFSSLVALVGHHIHAYTAAKGGVLSLTRALAASYGPRRIRVNVICPGLVLTDRIKDRFQTELTNGSMLSDMFSSEIYPFSVGDPIDVANIALFLASDESRMIHGATIVADGGKSSY